MNSNRMINTPTLGHRRIASRSWPIRAVPSLVINGTILVGCGVYLAWLSEDGLLPRFEGPMAAPRTAVVLITR
jgi:hypothetical protein